MKKIILGVLLILSFANAKGDDVATKDDIRAVKDDIKELSKQMDKRFEQIDKRLDMMQHYMDKRFEQVDKRFEQVDKRFEQVDKRFEMMENRFNWIMGLIIGGFVFFYRYLLVEHRKLKDYIVNELRSELEKKADKNRVEKIVAVIEDFARKDEEFRKILEKHHLKYVA